MTLKNALMIAVIFAIAVVIVQPVSADMLTGECIVPPDVYFVTDGPMNGQPVHDGIQLGQGAMWITAKQRVDGFTGGHHLGLTWKTYAPGKSHNEQEQLAFQRIAYCYSLPDYPYRPGLTDDQYAALSPYGPEEPVSEEPVIVIN